MKDIGFTQEGNRLVEMNANEYRAFMMLHDAIEGEGYPALIPSRDFGFREVYDFTTTFGVIRAYYSSGFQINQFQQLLDEMKKSLEQKG